MTAPFPAAVPAPLAALCCCCCCVASLSARAQDFVDQLQIKSGVVIRHELGPGAGIPLPGNPSGLTERFSGSFRAAPLEPEGAVFSLYAARRGAAAGEVPRLLFRKALGTLVPKASLVFSSPDPRVPARTRADVPFTVRLSGSGWEDLPGALSIECERFDPRTHAGRAPPDTRTVSTFAFGDGTRVLTRLTELRDAAGGDDPRGIDGLETWTVWARPPEGFPEWTVVRQSIRVLPAAAAEVTGVEENEDLAETPRIDAVFTNLYPDSETWFQVYPGAAGEGKAALAVPGTLLVYKAESPQSAVLRIPEETLAPCLPDDGTYTLEAVTLTPLKPRPERLWRRTFTLTRRLEIRARAGPR